MAVEKQERPQLNLENTTRREQLILTMALTAIQVYLKQLNRPQDSGVELVNTIKKQVDKIKPPRVRR